MTALKLARWTFAALGALFLNIQPKAQCGVCLDRYRDLDAHVYMDHCGDDCGVAG